MLKASLAVEATFLQELFPMMVVSSAVLRQVRVLRPFQEMLQRELVRRRGHNAIVSFVSHKWRTRSHPDPDGAQLRCLQNFLEAASVNRVRGLFSDQDWCVFKTGALRERPKFEGGTNWGGSAVNDFIDAFSRHGGDAPDELLSSELAQSSVWIDYLSVPQEVQLGDDSQLRAIYSIPSYIKQSSFFIILCPSVRIGEGGECCDYDAWQQRGWCRFEEWVNMLSTQRVVPVVLTDTHAWTIDMIDFLDNGAQSRVGAVACGDFACCRFGHQRADGTEIPCDKDAVLQVLETMWLAKLDELAMARNLSVYLTLRCLETKMFARSPEAPFRAAWGPSLAHNADPHLVAARIEADGKAGLIDRELPVICIAASLGDERVLRACVERGMDPLIVDKWGNTCLSEAVESGSAAAVEYLLSLPSFTVDYINANMPDPSGKYFAKILHWAARNGQTVELLLRCRADPAPRNWSGQTPLHCAATLGCLPAASALLTARAPIDAQDQEGRTPLHLAAVTSGLRKGRLGIMRCLLEHGASSTIRDSRGLAAGDVARRDGCQAGLDLLCGSAVAGARSWGGRMALCIDTSW